MASPQSGNLRTKQVVSTERARQGETSGHVRIVLHVSLALAVIAGVILYAIYFL